MKIKTTNEEGEEIEMDVVPTEEHEAKLKEKETEFEAKLKEKDESLTTLNTEKAELEKKIEEAKTAGIKEDSPNFKVLKEALAKKDTDIAGLKSEIDKDRAIRKSESMDAAVKIATKGNAEFEKKVRLHLEKTLAALPDNTAEERKIKIDAAIKLSADTSTEGPGMFDEGTGGQGFSNTGTNLGGETNKVEFTSREKGLGNKLGISDEDYKKYQKDPRLLAMNKKK